jgi:hypothetical protein
MCEKVASEYAYRLKYERRGGSTMDFLTSLAYWGMAVLVIINAIIVLRMKVDIGDDQEGGADKTKCQSGI